MAHDVKIDFFSELHSRNMGHIIDQICCQDMTHYDIVNLQTICKKWQRILQGDESGTSGTIWRRILFSRCSSDNMFKYTCLLNNWWPRLILLDPSKDANLIETNGALLKEENIEDIGNASKTKAINRISEKDEYERILAVFLTNDVRLNLRLNNKHDDMCESQTRLLFAGGIVSCFSFCGDGGRYLFCGMLSGDIKMWELWAPGGGDKKRNIEALGRPWKVFKGHEERINAFDFLELKDSKGMKKDIVFASASNDHSFRVWSFQNGSQLRVVRYGTGMKVHAILLFEDYIATLTSDSGTRFVSERINLYKGK